MIDDHARHRESAKPIDANVALARRRAEPNRVHGLTKASSMRGSTSRGDPIRRNDVLRGREFFTRFPVPREPDTAIMNGSAPQLPKHSQSILMDVRRVAAAVGRRVFSAAAGATLVALI